MNTETLSKLSHPTEPIDFKDVMDIGDLYMRTLPQSEKGLAALGQFMVTRWPTIRAALEKASKDEPII